ncbi:MAG: LysR family transcriptional regulator [Acetobacteraceae bacterium]|nr:LysR family transcriptional regulator [Acetobacteraceae bacterium]
MNLSRLDLNLLVALEALLDEAHVTRAAQRANISQPAMSDALHRLRRLFGDELLVRIGREYQLTTLAMELREPLHELLQLAEGIVQRREVFDPSRDSRVFNLVISEYSGYVLVQPLLQRIAKEAPGVSLHLQRTTRGEPEKITSDLNIGLWPSPGPADLGLPSEILFEDRWVCAVWAGNDDIADTITLDDYLRRPHAVYHLGQNDRLGIADRAIQAMNHPRHVQVAADSFLLLPLLLEKTPQVAFIHERLGKKLAAIADIRMVEPLFEMPPLAEAMYWQSRNTSDPAHKWLRSMLREVAAGL